MKKIITKYLTFFFFLPLVSYGQDYEPIKVKSNTSKDTIGRYDIHEYYEYEKYRFAVGSEIEGKDKYLVKIFVFHENGNLIYKSDGQADSMIFDLKFYRSKHNPNIHLIFGHMGNEYSWGNEVFSFANGEIKHLGLIDIATNDPMEEVYWDIAPYTRIYEYGKKLRFEFTKDTIVFNPGGRNEKLLESKRIQYWWNGQKMELKNNR